MLEDYVYSHDPAQRAKNLAYRAIVRLDEALQRGDTSPEVWNKVHPTFLQRLKTTYKEVGGPELYEIVYDYWTYCKCLYRASKVLSDARTRDRMPAEFIMYAKGAQGALLGSQQLHMLYTQTAIQTKFAHPKPKPKRRRTQREQQMATRRRKIKRLAQKALNAKKEDSAEG
jgi:hypothetical protein